MGAKTNVQHEEDTCSAHPPRPTRPRTPWRPVREGDRRRPGGRRQGRRAQGEGRRGRRRPPLLVPSSPRRRPPRPREVAPRDRRDGQGVRARGRRDHRPQGRVMLARPSSRTSCPSSPARSRPIAAGAAAAKDSAAEAADRAPDAYAVLKGDAVAKKGGKGKWLLLLGALAAGAAVMAWRKSNERPDPWATAGSYTPPEAGLGEGQRPRRVPPRTRPPRSRTPPSTRQASSRTRLPTPRTGHRRQGQGRPTPQTPPRSDGERRRRRRRGQGERRRGRREGQGR